MFDVNNFIFQLPDFSKGLAFNRETVYFLLLILLTGAGILLCMKGYKYFLTLCTLCIGIIAGGVSAMAADRVAKNPLVSMALFVIGSFMMVCFLYLISILIRKLIIRWIHPKSAPYVAAALSSLLGAGGLALIVYFRIYRNLPMSILIGTVILALSLWHGIVKAKQLKPFYTYDDLLRRNVQPEPEAVPEAPSADEGISHD